jgi:phosphoglycerol transferase MdoB-like AlkP superfamily enzyme
MFRGPLTVLLLRLGLVATVYTVLRVLFWLYNLELFPAPPASAFAGGLRFDASAIAWLHLPWVLLMLVRPRPGAVFARFQFGTFLVINAVALFFACVDLGYFAFSLKRSTADFLQILTAGGDTANLAPAFLRDYWHIGLVYLACMALIAWGYLRIGRLYRDAPFPTAWRIGWRVLAVGLLALASRGGTQLIPLQPLDAARYGGASYLPVVLNTPFTMLMSLGKPTLVERHYMPQAEADALWPVEQQLQKGIPVDSTAIGVRPERPNVVIIILESFSSLYSARLSGDAGYMPFLDSLMEQSLTFTNAYANGRRSIDGIPAILAGIPHWMDEAFVTSPYASQPFTSLASLLAAQGYRTSFYHGGRNGTMGFDGFAQSAGFQRYVGLNEYDNGDADFDGHWGVRDRPFLQFLARQLAQEPQPFMSTVFTLSSHHPYELPAEEAARFAGGTEPIHPTLRYTDDALRAFFATVRTMPWYTNTLFVITSDHTADLERTGSQGKRPIDHWVPLVYHATWLPARTITRVTQHIDILPTVADLLDHPAPFFAFGHSALRNDVPPSAVWTNNGLYTMINGAQQIQFDGEHVLGVTSLRDGAAPDVVMAAEMELHLKAAIQQFNGRMIRSELTLEPQHP